MRAKLLRKAKEEQQIDFQGIGITIEWPKGSTREGVGKDGKPWTRKMEADYGMIPGTRAKGDQEDLDVYVGPNHEAPEAYVVEQLTDDGEYDEPKVMLGFDSEDAAREMYLKHYPAGWEDHIGGILTVPVARLAEMVDAEQTATEQRALEEADPA